MKNKTSLIKFILIVLLGSPFLMIMAFIFAGMSLGFAIPAGLLMYYNSFGDNK